MHTFISKFAEGDIVDLLFPNNGILHDCIVKKVSFGKEGQSVRYDLAIPFDYIPDFDLENDKVVKGEARIHSVKEWHLRDPLNAVSDRLLPDTADEQ